MPDHSAARAAGEAFLSGPMGVTAYESYVEARRVVTALLEALRGQDLPDPDFDSLVRDAMKWRAASRDVPQHGDPQEGDLCTAVRRYLGYIADIRSGRVLRLDRDVVLNYAGELERHLIGTTRLGQGGNVLPRLAGPAQEGSHLLVEEIAQALAPHVLKGIEAAYAKGWDNGKNQTYDGPPLGDALAALGEVGPVPPRAAE